MTKVKSPAELATRMRDQKDARLLAGDAIDAARKAAAEGHAIVQRARDDYALTDTDDGDGPVLQAWMEGGGPAAPALAPLSDLMLQIIASVVASERTGRGIVAAVALAALRTRYDALDRRELPADEQSWDGFAAKHVPLPPARVAELIGRMAHAGGIIRCSRCSAKSKTECGCGAPYVGVHRWAMPVGPAPERKPDGKLTLLTALDRAMAAITAHPAKSNRSIAAEIGVAEPTVRRARRQLKKAGTDDAVDDAVRIGRDGRRRRDTRPRPGVG